MIVFHHPLWCDVCIFYGHKWFIFIFVSYPSTSNIWSENFLYSWRIFPWAAGNIWWITNEHIMDQAGRQLFLISRCSFYIPSIFPVRKHKYACAELMQAQSTQVRGRAICGYVVPGQNDFLSRWSLCHSEVMKLLACHWEMRIPLTKCSQCAVNIICLVPNTVGINRFFLHKIHLFQRHDLKLLSDL